jgi:hypothetical protein
MWFYQPVIFHYYSGVANTVSTKKLCKIFAATFLGYGLRPYPTWGYALDLEVEIKL